MTANSSILINLNAEEKQKAQKILKNKFGLTLVDYIRMQIKKLNATGLLNADYAESSESVWNKKEKEMFETAEKGYEAGNLELVSDQEFSGKLKAKIAAL